jgi:glucokinase
MVFLTMGTGLGAGIILDGRLYRGASGLAGEVGHLRLTRTGPVGHGKAGSAEGWASGGGLARAAESAVAQARRRRTETTLAAVRARRALTARDVAAAARKRDPIAMQLVRRAAERLGELLAILVDLLNPEKIVIGGMAPRLGDALLGPAREAMLREALRPAAEGCEVVPAALGERIGDVAALCVAMGL